jgi:hypothetical protein
MMPDKFRVDIGTPWRDPWPQYFDNFLTHCQHIAKQNGWATTTVANYQLRPLGGKLITTKTHGWYLRWDAEANHTAFVLKWT